mgnify:CR=1 FL=1
MEDIKSILLKIASPEEILSWSHGEVTKPETINYRTQRPERDGLFSERIFGPTRDYECYCGKYKKIRYKGIVCDRCGVEVTHSSVRRERMGHIKLAVPVAHIWFLRSVPSRIGLFLDMSVNALEKVIYYTGYIITKVDHKRKEEIKKQIEKEYQEKLKKKDTDKELLTKNYHYTLSLLNLIKEKQVISERQLKELSQKFGEIFEAEIGSEPIKRMLEEIDLEKLKKELEEKLKDKKVKDRKRLIARLGLVKSFIRKNLRPEWMFLTILPVLPPDLRPMVQLDGGRYATSDLNDLYRRVINRNNRLKKLLELNAPEVIIRNEKRLLQEAVDALIDNSARAGKRPVASSQKRPLRSLTDLLRGKRGRFRQNLLGKRVDYSARSVIVVGPELQIDECGLPKKMALELFKPFVIHKLMEQGIVHNIRTANILIQQAPPEVWKALEEVIEGKYVLLNRAPTLHRLSIQAFKPILIEDLCIRIPPLVCGAFNADFDGDQMAVYLPLSDEAQKEARELMIASRNLLKPATGSSIVHLAQDIILGCYYLTLEKEEEKKEKIKVFADENEVIYALETKSIDLHQKIKVKVKGEIRETTAGRVIFNLLLPEDFPFINQVLRKKEMKKLANDLIYRYGMEEASKVFDKIKEAAFEYATLAGYSWGMDDLVIPKEKKNLIKEAEKETQEIWRAYQEGLLSENERREKVIEVWMKVRDKMRELVPQSLNKEGPVFAIIDSGSRGSWEQPLQMSGMKGLVQNPKGEIIELPIKSSYKEGFNVLEYFIATHGARKGNIDTALKTSSAGYLTRRLVDVAQDVIVREKDCGTQRGIEITKEECEKYGRSLAERIFGRIAAADIVSGKKVIVKKGEMIDLEKAKMIESDPKIKKVKVRSPLTCKTLYGVCSKCYGLDLGRNHLVEVGTPVGVIAAQSIGEPGTQLTMRTFHIGGIAGADITHGLPRVEELFEVKPPKTKAVISEVNGKVVEIKELENDWEVIIQTKDSKGNSFRVNYLIPKDLSLKVEKGDLVVKGQALSEGAVDVKALFKLSGAKEVWRYLLNEIQKVYISQGVSINDKHIEVIIRQMFSRVRIKDPGDSEFIEGEIISKSRLIEENRKLVKEGKKPAKAVQLLLGISKAAYYSDSFLSAASFQETTRALVKAACSGGPDRLLGLKENVIIGRLIPAGTGFRERKEKKS